MSLRDFFPAGCLCEISSRLDVFSGFLPGLMSLRDFFPAGCLCEISSRLDVDA